MCLKITLRQFIDPKWVEEVATQINTLLRIGTVQEAEELMNIDFITTFCNGYYGALIMVHAAKIYLEELEADLKGAL